MARRRFFVDHIHRGEAEILGDEAEHLRKVLRAEIGQRYELSDNQQAYLAEIVGFGKHQVRFRVLEEVETPEPAVRLILLASLIKFDRFEWMIEKATELGVDTIVPVHAERSDFGLDRAAPKRVERWRRIARGASQQSRRVHMPRVLDLLSLRQAVEIEADFRFWLDEAAGAPPLIRMLPAAGGLRDGSIGVPTGARVACLVGPEGGWSGRERESLSASAFQSVSLGPAILRSETAAMAALALINHCWFAGTLPSKDGDSG
jgi:16S rRNA (uracil1498-N3)-methyltransferase